MTMNEGRCIKIARPLAGHGLGHYVDCPCVLQDRHEGPCQFDLSRVRETNGQVARAVPSERS
jgi:hypothetical protein